MDPLFFKIFESLERQGPGDDGSTIRAFTSLKDLPDIPNILDVGCGSGRQTTVLSLITTAKITAIDIHPPFIDTLNKRIASNHYQGITTLIADMHSLPFEKNSYDLIWSEGAVFIMGFENALVSWKDFLRPGGYMVVSELVWFKKDVPEEINKYLTSIYPPVKHYDDVTGIISKTGYNLTQCFPLPTESWWTDYYTPMERVLTDFKKLYNDEGSKNIFNMFETEIEMFRKHSEYYGYMFFIMRNKV